MKSNWKKLARPLRKAIARALRPARRFSFVERALAGTFDYLFDCRTVRCHLSELHDDDLPPRQARLVRAHLETCEVCSGVDASLRETVTLLGELRE